jgi:hypothetical protein
VATVTTFLALVLAWRWFESSRRARLERGAGVV